MTDQEAFNIMVQHLRTQGAQSLQPGRGCLYRHPDGVRRCAVGVLIPDEQYQSSLEDNTVEMIYEKVPALHSINLRMLSMMQDAHDSRRMVGSRTTISWAHFMEEEYKEIAQEFGLTVPPHPCVPEVIAPQHDSTKVSYDSWSSLCYE